MMDKQCDVVGNMWILGCLIIAAIYLTSGEGLSNIVRAIFAGIWTLAAFVWGAGMRRNE